MIFENNKKTQTSDIHIGRNHLNETKMLGIVAHCLWEENLGNVTEVFVNSFFWFIAQSLWFRCPKFIPEEKIVIQNHSFLR